MIYPASNLHFYTLTKSNLIKKKEERILRSLRIIISFTRRFVKGSTWPKLLQEGVTTKGNGRK